MRKARAFLTILLATGCSAHNATPKDLPISPDSPLTQVASRKYAEVLTLGEIDPAVLRAVLSELRYDPRIADAESPWEATDNVMSDAPGRRLLVAGHSKPSWILLYEHGGRGLHHHLVTIQSTGGAAVVDYWGTGYASKSWRTLQSSKIGLKQLQAAARKGWFGPNEWGVDADK